MYRRILGAFALFACAGVAHASDKPLYAPAPDWVKPAPPIDATHLSDSDPIMYRLDQQQRLENGQVWIYVDAATRIATPQVLTQAGTLPLPWDPSKGDLIIHKVEIIRGTEHIDLLANGARFSVIQREQQLEQASLNGMLTATMTVEGLRVGDLLRASFSITRKDPALHGHLQTEAPLVPGPMRLEFGRLRLLWPKGTDVHWRAYNKDTPLQEADAPGGYRELLVPLPVAKLTDMPTDAPLRYRPLPLLDASSYASWTDVSKDLAPFFKTEGTIAPGSPLADEVAKIAAASTDPRTRAAMALQLVQDKVRYLFRGMDDGNYVPQAPAQTWSLRYGDCKAKTLLLVAILRALGVEADPVLVNTEAGDLLPTRLPMPGAFNHVIARAVIGGDTLWLDGTGAGSRAADLTDVPPFRHALPLRDGGSELVDMPLRPAARPSTDADIEIDATGGINFPMPYKAQVTLRGQQVEMLRNISAQMGKEQTDAMVDSMLNGFLGTNQVADRKIDYDEASGTARITATGIDYSGWSRENGRFKVQLDSTVNGITFNPDRARAAWRDIPVVSGTIDDTRVRRRIHLPRGGAGFALEGDQTLPPALGGTLLKRNVSLADGWITIDDRVTTGITEVAPADIPATRAQVALAKTRLLKATAPADYPQFYEEIAPAKRAKAFDPILAVYAKAIADKPDDAERYTNRAWFLESIYDRQGALKDVDKAIELSPTVDNYLWRARLRIALNDDARALSDAQAALALDPSSSAAISQIASLEGKQGKRAEALATLAEHAAQGGQETSVYMLAQADMLGDDGKAEEGVALLDQAIAAKPGSPDLLNERCWLKGTRNLALDTALKDCSKSIELSEDPSAALDSRAMVYFRMGRMDEALADLDAALEASPSQAASLYMRGVIRKRTGAKGADEDLAAARLIAPRVDEDYAKYGIKP